LSTFFFVFFFFPSSGFLSGLSGGFLASVQAAGFEVEGRLKAAMIFAAVAARTVAKNEIFNFLKFLNVVCQIQYLINLFLQQ
jgi:hypothetical protein